MLVQVSHVSCKRDKISHFSQDSSQIPDFCDLKPFFLILTSALVQDYGFQNPPCSPHAGTSQFSPYKSWPNHFYLSVYKHAQVHTILRNFFYCQRLSFQSHLSRVLQLLPSFISQIILPSPSHRITLVQHSLPESPVRKKNHGPLRFISLSRSPSYLSKHFKVIILILKPGFALPPPLLYCWIL